ncbi:hypothetical protein G7054_g5315 [Neopestalotiopsis clavispora]|nr:hypothetical protein G7054_g5315 [Neopestalotiopsis clavispora]
MPRSSSPSSSSSEEESSTEPDSSSEEDSSTEPDSSSEEDSSTEPDSSSEETSELEEPIPLSNQTVAALTRLSDVSLALSSVNHGQLRSWSISFQQAVMLVAISTASSRENFMGPDRVDDAASEP